MLPVINSEGSDSAMLDNTLEFLVMSGMELPLAVMIMIPGAVGKQQYHVAEEKGFLPVLRDDDGAVGRTGIHPLFRWRYDGSRA